MRLQSTNEAHCTPVSPITIYEQVGIECARFQHVDAATVAHRVLVESGLGFTQKQIDYLLPVVVAAVNNLRRTQVRSAESAVFNKSRRPVAVTGTPPLGSDIRALRALLSKSFRVDKGADLVSWGKATAAQHRQRATALRNQARGVQETAGRHETAAQLIDDTGTSCLEEALAKKDAA